MSETSVKKVQGWIRWSVQLKVFILVLLVLLGTVAAVIWKTQTLVSEDKAAFLADSGVRQMGPLRKLVSSRIDSEKERLVQFAMAHSEAVNSGNGKGSNSALSENFGDLDIVSLVQPNATGQWAPVWTEKSSAARSDRWPEGYDLTLLKSLPYAKVRNGEAYWARLSDRQGLPIYALMVSVEVQAQTPAPGAKASKPGSAFPELPSKDAENAQNSGAVQKAIVVGFAGSNPLAPLTEEFIGSINGVYIVDDKGYVASHNNRAFLGALFSEDPIVQDIMKTQRSEGSGRFEDLESQTILGHYERVDGTNLYTVITTPLTAVTNFTDTYLRTALLAAVAVGLVGLLLAWLVGQTITDSFAKLSLAVQSVIRGGSASQFQVLYSKDEFGQLSREIAEAFRVVGQDLEPVASAEAHLKPAVDLQPAKGKVDGAANEDSAADAKQLVPPPLARATKEVDASREKLAEERQRAFEAYQTGLSEMIKEPLMAILGHVQLTRAKSDDPDVRNHAESIERETRRVRAAIDRLQNFDQSTQPLDDSHHMRVDQIVRAAIEKFAADLIADGIELETQIEVVPEIRGEAEQISSAIGHLIENAREALYQRPNKKITISLKARGNGANAAAKGMDSALVAKQFEDSFVLEIGDNGVGMSRDVQERIFEPFYKNFPNPSRMGLGLAYAASAMKRLGGSVSVDSSPGEGSTFRLSFPVTAAERSALIAETSLQSEKPSSLARQPVQSEPRGMPKVPDAPPPISASSVSDAAEVVTPELSPIVPPPLLPTSPAPSVVKTSTAKLFDRPATIETPNELAAFSNDTSESQDSASPNPAPEARSEDHSEASVPQEVDEGFPELPSDTVIGAFAKDFGAENPLAATAEDSEISPSSPPGEDSSTLVTDTSVSDWETLGGKTAVVDLNTLFPPPPPLAPAEKKQMPPAGASLSSKLTPGAPLPSAAPASAPEGKRASLLDERLSSAMESIAAATAAFDDDDNDETFANVSLATAASTLKPTPPPAFKVKIRKPRLKT